MTEVLSKDPNGVISVQGNAQTFPFSQNDNVLNVSLDVLKRTLNYEDYNGKLPHSKPTEHFNLIDSLLEKVDKSGYTANIESIYIKDSYSKRIGWKKKEEPCPIENYRIERLVSKIIINRNEEDKEMPSSLALSFSEKGIEIAMGINVRVCTNFNIFGKKRVATFGERKMPFREMMELVEAKWIHNIDEEYNLSMKQIEVLKNKTIDVKKSDEMFGELFKLAVRKNMDPRLDAPLNQTQVAATVRNFIAQEKDIYNMWDFTNSGTQALHIYRNDFQNVLESIESFNAYTISKI